MGTAVESVPLQSILQGKRESVGEAEEAGGAGEKEDAGTRGHGTVTRGKNKPTLRERLRRTTFKL
ncbi:MAG: hypothetical protein BRC41_14700 [Cyanobacteria bacterium QH_9_48_43]|nr:MAG: hypothetical protein BRC36_13145 [Cyanobacteria bacterium QH_2_48_84]PSO69950.1 MAG: hypothetical protein BRC42_10895 [Cyanobacteria bacterium QS_1_48_34]PSO81757.1 MAG: hypothetical protein BRC41_14700 [Cyanobacteria bacterium QH_9_48_43]PSO94594.1 MAG: hypothetical protein BRC53_12285 [Cyanobacteria bacterium SW_6_48_11]PSO95311.1 MAG: hypothetical protein BRC48_08740 [Cyanobacteria bacterium QS_9_48_30]PSP30713.1 MAG: hypothetical protein BRC59_01820 [Cyanobacteria bacterium SW_4_48